MTNREYYEERRQKDLKKLMALETAMTCVMRDQSTNDVKRLNAVRPLFEIKEELQEDLKYLKRQIEEIDNQEQQEAE